MYSVFLVEDEIAIREGLKTGFPWEQYGFAFVGDAVWTLLVRDFMCFFITMFVCNLLIPLIMIIGGYLMWKKPPRNINSVMGYRTAMSKKNMDTWKFAHDYCGRLWLKLGLIILVPSIVAQIPFVHADDDTIGLMTLVLMMVQLAVVVASIFPVEKALKQTFDKDGVRL